jgi:Ras-related protein Rab-1A
MVSSFSDIDFKVLLLGDSNVGKTCLLLRYIDDTFTENHMMTIGVDYKIKIINTPDQEIIRLKIWDTAGQDRFKCITKNYYQGSDGILLLYDTTSMASFTNIKKWISQIKDHVKNDVCITLVGNKVDLVSERQVSTEMGNKLANDYNINFYETSSKKNLFINEAFENLWKNILHKKQTNQKEENSKVVKLRKRDKLKKCCTG